MFRKYLKIGILVAAALLVFGALQFRAARQWHPVSYDMKQVFYTTSQDAVTVDVRLDNIRKEKNKEDVYEFFCQDVDGDFAFPTKLRRSKYISRIGTENNSASGVRYTLDITVLPEHPYEYMSFSLRLHRYSFLCETNFTEEEISKIAAEMISEANKYAQAEDWGNFEALRNRYAPATSYYFEKSNIDTTNMSKLAATTDADPA